MLQAEHDENVVRKDFTVSERVAMALSLEATQPSRVGVNQYTSGGYGNISIPSDVGQKRDIVAKRNKQHVQSARPYIRRVVDSANIRAWQT
jgi:hypothetical protein